MIKIHISELELGKNFQSSRKDIVFLGEPKNWKVRGYFVHNKFPVYISPPNSGEVKIIIIFTHYSSFTVSVWISSAKSGENGLRALSAVFSRSWRRAFTPHGFKKALRYDFSIFEFLCSYYRFVFLFSKRFYLNKDS